VTDGNVDAGPCELTVVIPARNEERMLPAQLEALLTQNWSGNWEVVVADNGSTDGTADIVRRYAQAGSRVRIVDARERHGVNYSRNAGVLAGQGRSVAFCDADDVVGTGWVAAVGEALRRHEFVTGPLELDELNPAWLAATRGRGDERGLATFYNIFPYPHGNNFGLQRSVWEQLGRFDENFPSAAEDAEFGLRAWRAGVALHFVEAAVVHYRYRAKPRELWRQGTAYGQSRPLIRRRLKELGAPAPNPAAGWRSWLWLAWHLPSLRSAEGRAAWVWVAANRVGHVKGSLRHRCLLV
jgi:glycosyltransferase involved in cell wall biosynthesis